SLHLSRTCMVLFSTIAAWSLARWPGEWKGMAIGAIGATGACYSAGDGPAVWIAALLILSMQPKIWSRKFLTVWILLSIVAGGIYLWGYSSISFVKKPEVNVFNYPVMLIFFPLTIFGSPFRVPAYSFSATILGGVAIALTVSSLFYLKHRWKNTVPMMMPWV